MVLNDGHWAQGDTQPGTPRRRCGPGAAARSHTPKSFHHERLHACETQHHRAAMAKFLDARLAVVPWVWRARRECPARQ
jgi:hypothetical protein